MRDTLGLRIFNMVFASIPKVRFTQYRRKSSSVHNATVGIVPLKRNSTNWLAKRER
jgi:hypothetical protein